MVKNLPANAGDIRDRGSIPGLERFPGGGNGNPLQYSCLENPLDRGSWWATVHRIRSQTPLKRLHTHTHTHTHTQSNFMFTFSILDFPVAQTVKCLPIMWETRVRSLGREDPLEKEMATHSSVLAWKIPWTEEPGGI